ncbi:hypothetical protein [Marinobacter sp. BGYM27]|uniref:hypothetical protein n=1 Tax=Marinobacter sp. BGYM27 TaxID=2975597 RepID=UPI0021A30A9A|nr:hypothetical protein [Marinobacter sp. BGYM27]MDG5498942.1 hypothetical protein [Marinobacter sp. BGYM27]
MNPAKREGCSCQNCDRSCFRHQGVTGTTHKTTTPDRAKARIASLKALVAGGAA